MTADTDAPPLRRRTAATPDREAVVDTDTGVRLSYRELMGRVTRLTDRLAASGVTPGDRVGLVLPRGLPVVQSVHAVFECGGTVVPVDPAAPPQTVQRRLEHAGVTAVCHTDTTAATADAAAPTDTDAETDTAADNDSDTDTNANTSANGDGRAVTITLPSNLVPGDGTQTPAQDQNRHQPPAQTAPERVTATAAATETKTETETVPGPWQPDREAVVMFTAGTTGRPAGVRLTGRNLRASAEASAYRLGTMPADGWLDCLPMFHMGGFAPIMRTAYNGTTLYLQRSFDPDTTATVLQTHEITGLSVVPTMLDRLLASGWTPPDQLRTVLTGGAPAPAELLDRARERDVPVAPTYGLTETASQVATAAPGQAAARTGTVGQPLVGASVTIVDGGTPVRPDTSGEIVVSGPTVASGYIDPDRTEAAMGPYGLRTGDRGYKDEDGYLWVTGRLDDQITTGGVTVAPAVVADAVCAHPAVEAATVVGVTDPTWGERVCAAVVPTGPLDRETLEQHCRDRLAAHKRPKQYQFVERLPRTASGTVDRAAVRGWFDD